MLQNGKDTAAHVLLRKAGKDQTIMKKNIILIGMPGSGKSTIGVLLAKALGMSFVDTDLEIMQRTGKKLQEILDAEGLEAFLRKEEDAVIHTSCAGAVIATGGSVVLEPAAMEHLKKNGICVFLEVPLDELKYRIKNIKSRGIAFAVGQNLTDIFRERTPLYQKYADIIVETGVDVEDTVEKILKENMI